jgi:hypothetical protein
MWKSDFRMGRKLKLLQFDNFCNARDIFFIFFEKTCQIEAWNRNIAWSTPTGIQFPNGLWVLGMEISSSLGLKKNLKVSPWEGKAYLPSPREVSFSSRGLTFGGFFNPWDEEISIPETRPIRKSYIFETIYNGWIMYVLV